VAAYSTDPVESFLGDDMRYNNFTACSVADGALKGKYLVCEAADTNGNEYLFICFRGTKSQEDIAADLKVKPTTSTLGAIHAGFLERSNTFSLAPIMEAIQRGKKVVVCGHSLGGACAILLTARFFSKYGQYDMTAGQVTCVTFGSPLVGNAATRELMCRHAEHFHNFIYNRDFAPLSLTMLGEVAPYLAMPAAAGAAAGAQGGGVVGVVAAVGTALLSETVKYAPFGQFYHILPANNIPPESLIPMTPEELASHFNAENLSRIFDPNRMTDHAMVNYKNKLWAASGPPVPPYRSAPAPLPALQSAPTVRSCEVKGDLVIVAGRDLAYCNYLHLCGVHLSLDIKFSSSGERTVFTLQSIEEVQRQHVRNELASHSAYSTATQLIVSTVFGTQSEPTYIQVVLKRPEEYLSPGKVLGCILPIATLLIRADAEDTSHKCFRGMVFHAQGLADALPIEFAFRAIQSDPERSALMTHVVNRLAAVRLNWKALCSHLMVATLQSTLRHLRDLPLLNEKLRAPRLYTAQAPNLRVAHLVQDKVTLAVGQCKGPAEFWKLICNAEQGISFSVELYTGSSPAFPLIPDISDVYAVDGGFEIEYVDHPFQSIVSEAPEIHKVLTLVAQAYKIIHKASALEREFVHYSFSWGTGQLPDEEVFTALIEEVRAVIGEARYLRGTNCRAPCVYVADHTGSISARTGLFALCLAMRVAYKSTGTVDCQKMKQNIHEQLGTHEQHPLGLRVDHFSFIDRCEFVNPMSVRRVWRFVKDKLKGEGDNFAVAAGILKDHLYQMRSHSESVHAGAICGKSVTLPVCHATDLDTTSPFLDLFPEKIASNELLKTGLDQQKLVNLARESYFKATYLASMLEDAMSFSQNMIETEREAGIMLGANFAMAMMQAVAFVPVAAAKGIAAVATWDAVHLVDVHAAYSSFFHHAMYKQLRLSSYNEIVDQMCLLLGYRPFGRDTLVDKENYVVAQMSHLPADVWSKPLHELTKDKRTYFGETKFKALLQGKTAEMVVFFLKTIYHCSHLRRLRREITLVTIAGEKNAGKTTLNKKIFGPQVVKARTGTMAAATTIYPSAYTDAAVPDILFCDLPGCSDATTADMSDLFFTLGDVSVFLLDQQDAVNRRSGDIIYTTIAKVLSSGGPRLICINNTDCLLLDATNPAEKLRVECEKWFGSELFGNHLKIAQQGALKTAKWKCEAGSQAGAIVASIKTGDTALSIWMTAFNPLEEVDGLVEVSERLLFGASHVKAWALEAAEMVRTVRREDK
jgi:predicted membrane protein